MSKNDEKFFLYADNWWSSDPEIHFLKQKEWEKIFKWAFSSKNRRNPVKKVVKKERKLLF